MKLLLNIAFVLIVIDPHQFANADTIAPVETIELGQRKGLSVPTPELILFSSNDKSVHMAGATSDPEFIRPARPWFTTYDRNAKKTRSLKLTPPKKPFSHVWRWSSIDDSQIRAYLPAGSTTTWDTMTGKIVNSTESTNPLIRRVAASQDFSKSAVVSIHPETPKWRQLIVVDSASGKEIATMEQSFPTNETPDAVVLSRGATMLAAVFHRKDILVADGKSGESLKSFIADASVVEREIIGFSGENPSYLAIRSWTKSSDVVVEKGPNRTRLLIGGLPQSPEVELWNTATWEVKKVAWPEKVKSHYELGSAAFCADGKHFVVCRGTRAFVVECASAKIVHDLECDSQRAAIADKAPKGAFSAVPPVGPACFSSNGQELAVFTGARLLIFSLSGKPKN